MQQINLYGMSGCIPSRLESGLYIHYSPALWVGAAAPEQVAGIATLAGGSLDHAAFAERATRLGWWLGL